MRAQTQPSLPPRGSQPLHRNDLIFGRTATARCRRSQRIITTSAKRPALARSPPHTGAESQATMQGCQRRPARPSSVKKLTTKPSLHPRSPHPLRELHCTVKPRTRPQHCNDVSLGKIAKQPGEGVRNESSLHLRSSQPPHALHITPKQRASNNATMSASASPPKLGEIAHNETILARAKP